ncbi:hypothetical protein LQL77_29875 [Rhodococcus cerastii]|nr:hypothetical protein [Rhodococcus cerastii]
MNFSRTMTLIGVGAVSAVAFLGTDIGIAEAVPQAPVAGTPDRIVAQRWDPSDNGGAALLDACAFADVQAHLVESVGDAGRGEVPVFALLS